MLFFKKKPIFFQKGEKVRHLEKKNKTVAPPAWSKTKKSLQFSFGLWPSNKVAS